MKLPCGCCTGIQAVTPETEANRPGLPAIAYRVGAHATFLESMIARLSNLYLDIPAVDGSGSVTRLYPLKRLTTRDPSDPSIALLDAWAVVADVLTFYEERIANEGYLPTATERRSLLELARLVGYKLRPGVSASVYLAFTVANGFQGVIPAGTRSQSIPGTGETAQFFETSYDLPARDAWNILRPRLTRPQVITLGNNAPDGKAPPFDMGSDARTRDTIYLQGISTNQNAGDALLIVTGDGPGLQVLRFVASVNVQADQNLTEVVLQEPSPQLQTSAKGGPVQNAAETLRVALQPIIDEVSSAFPGSDIANQVAAILQPLHDNALLAASATAVAKLVNAVIPQVQQLHDIAVKRKFTRLEPWIGDLLITLRTLVDELPSLDDGETPGDGGTTPSAPSLATSSLAGLAAIIDTLAKPPSLQPANSVRLARTVTQAFSVSSDMAPRLLAAFKPAAASTLYKAWAGIEAPSATQLEIDSLRVKATLFASSFTGPATVPSGGGTVSFSNAPSIALSWGDLASTDPDQIPSAVPLDAVYDKIEPGSWIAIDRPFIDSNGDFKGRKVTFHQVQSVQTRNMDTTTGFAAKVTVLTLNPNWLSDSANVHDDLVNTEVLRGTVVYAQADPLDLAEEPLDRDVEGDAIELDGLYDGLESGRWIIVSGERTDISNTTGVAASELVMIAAVTQGPGKQSCMAFTTRSIPFTQIYYVTQPSKAGDRLVVAAPALLPPLFLNLVPLPNLPDGRQQICDPLQLAPGFYANVLVPTAAERSGDFSPFADALLDPATGQPFPGGIIPPSRWDPADPNNPTPVFAWRISTATSGSDTVHTTLVLANSLAYKYDCTKVAIYANVAKATHGQTVGEVLGDGDASQPFDTFALHQKPLTYISAPTPDGSDSTLLVRVNELQWHESGDLAGLGPKYHGFVTQTDNNDQTSVVFGNGEHGARVPTGTANIKATYRYGIGSPGNVQANQISQLATHPLGVQAVINPLPASGGADRDTIDQARRNAPVAVMALDRLVSTDDYAEFARTYAGIGKASAVRLSDGHRQLVHLTIAGAGDIPIDQNSDLYRNLVQSLLNFGDPYQPLQVCLRKVQLLVVAAGIQILPDYAWESVEPNIRRSVLDAFSFDNRDLGQSAFLSELVALIQNVEGVSYVDVETFDSVAEDVTAAQLAGLSSTLKRKPHVLAQLARLNPDFDPSKMLDPCQRVLPAELVFLSPDIPDTLILTQVGGL
jgi:Baseplate J-like protein